MSTKTKIHITYRIDATFDARQVWPDDDAPDEITAEAVMEVMKADARRPSRLIDEWNIPGGILAVRVGDTHADWSE